MLQVRQISENISSFSWKAGFSRHNEQLADIFLGRSRNKKIIIILLHEINLIFKHTITNEYYEEWSDSSISNSNDFLQANV